MAVFSNTQGNTSGCHLAGRTLHLGSQSSSLRSFVPSFLHSFHLAAELAGSYFSDQGWNAGPLQCKCVLTPGPPGQSLPGFLLHLFGLFAQQKRIKFLLCLWPWALFLVSLVEDSEPQQQP